jgi:arabinose-5-phosphate isomerase
MADRPDDKAAGTTTVEGRALARKVLQPEAAAILALVERLDERFDCAVSLLRRCAGRVIVTGIGKSGLIARKIAATLTSTGTAAIFLHPAEARHGDLGVIQSDDVILALSYSGETDELLLLLETIKRLGAKLIAVTGDPESTLAQAADVALDCSVAEEACPMNLVPTASTTAALAIGDALAMTLMRVKRLTPEDFAMNHPGGRLGKRLTLKVADLMHGGVENPTVATGATLLEVVQAISRGGLGAVNVVDDAGRLAGVVTDGDVRRTLQKAGLEDLDALKASDVMTREPVVAAPEMLAHAALQLMENRPSQIAVLPVVEAEGRCVGLLRLHDIVRSGL